jgi:uncharacterized protein YuzE
MSAAKAAYDPEADAISVRFAPLGARYAESEEVAPGVVLDFDEDGRVIGVELLYVRDLLAAGRAQATADTATAAE